MFVLRCSLLAVMLVCKWRVLTAVDGCTDHELEDFFIGSSCEETYLQNPSSHSNSGYYWVTNPLRQLYCDMEHSGTSCINIYNNHMETREKSGYYMLIGGHWVYCNMTVISETLVVPTCAGVEGGWLQVAHFDVSMGDNCPNRWNKATLNNVSFCQRPQEVVGCYRTDISTKGLQYKSVCGKARGYQQGSTLGFYTSKYKPLDSYYIDGMSITAGNLTQHIWTYAAGLTENGFPNERYNCPCAAIAGQAPPSYVGVNYYCESGTIDRFISGMVYLNDPLWDGEGCISGQCCNSSSLQPWFYRQLNDEVNQQDIQVRLCSTSNRTATLVDQLELYIQ